MKLRYCLILIFLASFLALPWNGYADDVVRGITFDPQTLFSDFDGQNVPLNNLSQPAQSVPALVLPNRYATPMDLDEWIPLDTLVTCVRVPYEDRFTLALNPAAGAMEPIYPVNQLTDYEMQAVARAPRWLRNDLLQNMNAFRGDVAPFFREMLAEMILEAEDPYVDELVFTIAHLAPDLICTGYLSFQLFAENVESIYEVDEHLDYVQIVDYGSSEDDDYYSTVEYKIKNTEGDTVDYELDPYYYYWYIVHPKLSDEYPVYINPASGNSAQPPRGVFWRDFLLYHPDDGYPSLLEAVEDCGVLWSNLHNNGSLQNGAVGAVTTWIHDVLDFDSGNERPIQPVRIYRLHMGRCGEHEDMTAAAGRSVLIPTIGIAAITKDHVWNEFYCGRWAQWEPVNNYVDDSLAYERWGNGTWRAAALFRWRGDGFLETVTSRYQSHTADLVMTVIDRDAKPVDGARLLIYGDYLHGGTQIATCAYTGSTGETTIQVGETQNVYLAVSTGIGNDDMTMIIEEAVEGEHYEWTTEINNEMPELDIEDADPPQNPVDHYNLHLVYEPLIETVRGRIFQYGTFFADLLPARIDFFICDEDNYNLYLDSEPFEALNQLEITETGEIDFSVPTDETWYAVFSNDQRISSHEEVQLTAYWSQDSEWSVPGDPANPEIPASFALNQNFPNPFNSSTNILFAIPSRNEVSLSIYDLNARQVTVIPMGTLSVGFHTVQFDAGQLDSGVYFYTIRAGEYSDCRKMILLK